MSSKKKRGFQVLTAPGILNLAAVEAAATVVEVTTAQSPLETGDKNDGSKQAPMGQEDTDMSTTVTANPTPATATPSATAATPDPAMQLLLKLLAAQATQPAPQQYVAPQQAAPAPAALAPAPAPAPAPTPAGKTFSEIAAEQAANFGSAAVTAAGAAVGVAIVGAAAYGIYRLTE